MDLNLRELFILQLEHNFNHSRFQKLNINFPFFIAPMVGLSHVAFRELIKFYTPPNVNVIRFTEMLSTRRIPNEKLESSNELRVAQNENYFIPQLLGNEEKYIAPSIEKLTQKNPFGFDINMGCPVSHTLKHNWGVRLMGDINYAASIVEITKKHTKLPVSVKLRGGADKTEDENYLLSFTSALEQNGADFLTIHARTRAQKHNGDANWGLVSRVRNKLSIPVIANGNIQNAQDAIDVIKEFGCDGAMIARAACARPWIIWQICENLNNNVTPVGFEGRTAPRGSYEESIEYGKACLKFLEILKHYFLDEAYILDRFRFFVATGARWFQFGHYFWKMTMSAKSISELENVVIHFNEKYENKMYDRINII
jgi:tRNA-dihydrouridine synthase B